MAKLTICLVLIGLLIVAQVNEAGFLRKVKKKIERVGKEINKGINKVGNVVSRPIGAVLRPIVQLLPKKRVQERVDEKEVAGNPAALPVAQESFEVGIVRLHNELRNMEHVPGHVAWDQPLADLARQWAVQCSLSYPVYGDSRDLYGQNVFATTSATAEPINAINTWYSYKPNYNPATGDCNPDTICTPYLQVTLPESTFLGCAQVTCPTFSHAQTTTSGSMIFCLYAPN
ncbi:hypothetical protein HELRODRAFT_188344 [Helobdella robusta]|uniref:SCP domain-containing protein n=1 Tax=Helobdella robusta TaxID=6412 RepID=T1FPW7_HELRO|nr:hypothetical protein HELRODRAFT_188344 [Helobdella robusta]ESO06383.1 hypothetical protein HELRODRAFT_188344 [Helobdella robusta]